MKYTLLYSEALTLQHVLKLLHQQAVDFLALIDSDHHLLGVISERDIREGLLSGKQKVQEFLNPQPAFLTQSEANLPIRPKNGHLYDMLPVLDDEGRLLELIPTDDAIRPQYSHPVVIMAGGLGKRLGELTQDIPKPMLPLGYKPVLHLILDNFLEHGFKKFYFCVNYKAEVIREYFGDGSQFGAQITYIQEETPLGTAGSLALLGDHIHAPFFVMNGDLITTLNVESFLHFHLEKEATATMGLTEFNHQLPYGVVHTRNSRILSLEEKPYQKYFVNAGIYLLDPKVFQWLGETRYLDMTTLFEQLLQADEAVHSYIINEFWVDIGQTPDYQATREVFTHFQR